MRNISTILSIIALALTGVLFYLHFSAKGNIERCTCELQVKTGTHEFKIAYFDIDSLQSSYTYYKDALEEMKGKESAANAELQDIKAKVSTQISAITGKR